MAAFVDFVLNSEGHGPTGRVVGDPRFDPGLHRPYIDDHGYRAVTINTGRRLFDNKARRYVPELRSFKLDDLAHRGIYSPVANATSMRKEDWIELDRTVMLAARQRLRAWADLAAANSYGGFNAMGKLTLEYEAQSDVGEAVVDMNGITPGRGDSPLYTLRSIPLPITHSDFWFDARRLAISRNGTPLDTTMAEMAARRVAEKIERTTIGLDTGETYGTQTAGYGTHTGTSTVYGYTNFPSRLTKTNMTVPTGSNPEATIADILAMRNSLYGVRHYGPYMIYHSTDWDAYLDNDYARLGGNNANMTLRDRIRAIDGIIDVRRLDFLTSTFTMIMVQMTPDVARAINGLDLTTVQWEEKGGMQLQFKVMCIQVPQLRYDYNGNSGIMHGTTA